MMHVRCSRKIVVSANTFLSPFVSKLCLFSFLPHLDSTVFSTFGSTTVHFYICGPYRCTSYVSEAILEFAKKLN
jgi:hypothetical protein